MASYRLQHLAEQVGGSVVGDADFIVEGIATLQTAGAQHLSFLANAQYEKYLASTEAGAVILKQAPADARFHVLEVDDPYLAYAKLSHLFAYRPASADTANVHPSAIVSDSASLAPGVSIGAHCVIGDHCALGEGVSIGAGSYVGDHCTVGAHTQLHPGVTLHHHVRIGEHCRLHSGAVIGADGFGFANHQGQWVKIAQLGSVRVGNHVDIGANTTIDRGALDDTVIEDHVILDNQIQIGHNCHIGQGSALAGCVGIAGSTKIGRYCIIGGATGIAGHLEIADQVHLAAMSMITGNITQPGVYASGTGFMESREWRKSAVRFRQLDAMAKRIKTLESRDK